VEIHHLAPTFWIAAYGPGGAARIDLITRPRPT
jgi:hypothetical protein